MPTTNNTTTPTKAEAARKRDEREAKEGFTKLRNGSTAIAKRTAESAVDVPVGAALTVADRVNEITETWAKPESRTQKLDGFRKRVERELKSFERRGSGARRKATTRARKTRTRAEREMRQNRQRTQQQLRKAEASLKDNRRRAEDGLKRARTTVQDRVSVLA